jgi:hypothetical protein
MLSVLTPAGSLRELCGDGGYAGARDEGVALKFSLGR